MTKFLGVGMPRLLHHPPVQERIAGDDLGDERLQLVAVLGDGAHHAVHDDLVVAAQFSAEGVGEEFFGEVAGEVVFPGGDDGLQFLGG